MNVVLPKTKCNRCLPRSCTLYYMKELRVEQVLMCIVFVFVFVFVRVAIAGADTASASAAMNVESKLFR